MSTNGMEFANLKLVSEIPSNNAAAETYLKEIDAAIKENETTSKWMDEIDETYDLVATDELNKLGEKWSKSTDQEQEEGDALRYTIVELTAKKCILLEIKIRRNEFEAADATALVKFIQEHKDYYADKEYLVGFRYIVNCMAIQGQLKELRMKVESKQAHPKALKDLLKSLNEYEGFGVQHKVAVLAVKQYFLGYLLRSVGCDSQIKLVRKLIEMDPENLEWRFCLYSLLRYKRKDQEVNAPSEDEINVIVEAMEKRYAKFDARICLGYVFCLAEIYRNSGKSFMSIKYGAKQFSSESDVLRCIRSNVDDVLAIDPTSVRSNIDIAKLYSSILPYAHRDDDFALVCIQRALLFHPNSSKANHRMGVFLISKNSPDSAMEYLEKAVETDEKNIYAKFDLLKAYLADVPLNKTKLDRIFSNFDSQGMPFQFKILLLEALYSYFDGNCEASVDLIVEAVETSSKSIELLERLRSDFKRFNWNDYNAFAKGILRILEHRTTFANVSDKEIINKIRKILQNTNDYNRSNRKRGHSSFRGNTEYGSGHKNRKSGGSRPFNYGSNYGSNHGSSGKSDGSRQNKNGGSDSKTKAPNEDNYAVLGLSKSTTQVEVKEKYRELAREHHPDKNMHLSSDELLKKQELMKRINTAYETLMNQHG